MRRSFIVASISLTVVAFLVVTGVMVSSMVRATSDPLADLFGEPIPARNIFAGDVLQARYSGPSAATLGLTACMQGSFNTSERSSGLVTGVYKPAFATSSYYQVATSRANYTKRDPLTELRSDVVGDAGTSFGNAYAVAKSIAYSDSSQPVYDATRGAYRYTFAVNPEDTTFWYCYLKQGSPFFQAFFSDVAIVPANAPSSFLGGNLLSVLGDALKGDVTSAGVPADFDIGFYKALYPDLRALSDSEAQKHYVADGQRENRCKNISQTDCVRGALPADFDPIFYGQTQPDLRVLGWSTNTLVQHYVDNGARENRCASYAQTGCNRGDLPVDFDPVFYGQTQADLRAQNFSPLTLAVHYAQYGRTENRCASLAQTSCNRGDLSTDFDVDFYRETQSDLRTQNFSPLTLAMHYVQYGRTENRCMNISQTSCNRGDLPVDFDFDFYRRNNADLAAAFGTSAWKYVQHYITNGQSENRCRNAAQTNCNGQVVPTTPTTPTPPTTPEPPSPPAPTCSPSSVANGSVGSYPGCTITCNSGYHLSGSSCVIDAINGVCGTAHGTTPYLAPTTNLCATGTASSVTGTTGPWSWTCAGVNGGTTASCSATQGDTTNPAYADTTTNHITRGAATATMTGTLSDAQSGIKTSDIVTGNFAVYYNDNAAHGTTISAVALASSTLTFTLAGVSSDTTLTGITIKNTALIHDIAGNALAIGTAFADTGLGAYVSPAVFNNGAQSTNTSPHLYADLSAAAGTVAVGSFTATCGASVSDATCDGGFGPPPSTTLTILSVTTTTHNGHPALDFQVQIPNDGSYSGAQFTIKNTAEVADAHNAKIVGTSGSGTTGQAFATFGIN